MISATAIPTTIARFADSLPFVSIDLSRFLHTGGIKNEALKNAYKQFTTTYGNLVDVRFDEEFLTNAGAGIIDAFTHGEMDRHDAARALAQAWNKQLDPARSAARKRRILDATMAADSLLAWLEAEMTGQPMVVEAVSETTVEATPTTIDEHLSLSVEVDEGLASSATIVAQGVLDSKSYHTFLMRAHQLYQQGTSGLTLDLSKITQIDLSGIYALHAAAKIFRGECYPRYEYGYAGLRHMVEENLDAGTHPRIRLSAINKRIQDQLEQAGVTLVFGQ